MEIIPHVIFRIYIEDSGRPCSDSMKKIPARPDFSHGLIHFTRGRTGKRRHFESGQDFAKRDETKIHPLKVIGEILGDGVIHGSNNEGFIKGSRTAVCFSEVPLSNVRYFLET